MDTNGIRLGNYRTLLLQFRARPDQEGLLEHGLLTRFAKVSGISPQYLSHIINGRKNIGQTVARRLESGLGMPHGWMDNDHATAAKSALNPEAEFLSAMKEIYREFPLEAQAMLVRFLMGKRKNILNPMPPFQNDEQEE